MTKGLGQFRRGLAPAGNTTLAALAFCPIVSSTEALESDTGFATVIWDAPQSNCASVLSADKKGLIQNLPGTLGPGTVAQVGGLT